MANKKIDHDQIARDVKAVNEFEKIAMDSAEAKYGSEMLKLKEAISVAPLAGAIKASGANAAFLRLTHVMMLRHTKEQLKEEGKWTAFCEAHGINIKNADREIAKLGEIKDEAISTFGPVFGYDINKIRYLAVDDSRNSGVEVRGSTVYFDGEEIPLAELPALAEDLKDKLKTERDERSAEKKTHERRMADEKKHIHTLEKELNKYKRHADDKGLTAEEDAFLQRLENLRLGFVGYMLKVDPLRMEDLSADNDPTVRMRAEYIALLHGMRSQINAAYDTAVESFGDPSMMPEEGWVPGKKI